MKKEVVRHKLDLPAEFKNRPSLIKNEFTYNMTGETNISLYCKKQILDAG